jgi:sugar lactone lactonase YvrE
MPRSARKNVLAPLLLSLGIGCGSAPTGPADVSSLTLPGDKYYPESLTIAADGTLLVGSLGTGQVVKFAPGSTTAEVFLAPGSVKNVSGVLVDDESAALYLCAVDITGTTAPAVKSFKLSDGSPLASYPLPTQSFCNDLAFDGQHNLYVADSYGKIFRLPRGGSALGVWSSDAALAPTSAMAYGADGIVWDGKDGLYVNTFTEGALLRIPIKADGSAGPAARITVTPALSFPDGMRLLADNTLLVAEGAGRVSKVTISGATATATALTQGLLGPTSVVRYQQTAWISEGQLGHLFGQLSGPPTTPFSLRRVSLP